MSSFQVRTDLALEARESVQDGGGEIHGVVFEEEELEAAGIHITRVIIETKNGAKAIPSLSFSTTFFRSIYFSLPSQTRMFAGFFYFQKI